MPIAIQSWAASDMADADGAHVVVVGREAGLSGLLLASAGVEAAARLTIDSQSVRLVRRSLCGTTLRTTPLANVVSVDCGECRPWREALVIALAGVPALAISGIGWMITTVMVLLAAAYCLINPRLFVEIVDRGGRAVRIEFAAATADGEYIDEETRAGLVAVVERLLLRNAAAGAAVQGGAGVAAGASLAAGPAGRPSIPNRVPTDAVPAFTASGSAATAAPVIGTPDALSADRETAESGGESAPMRLDCPTCGASVRVNDGFCGACGHRLPFLPQ